MTVLNIVAVSIPDGTVYGDFTNPVNVNGSIGVAWTTDAPATTWIETTAAVFLANGVSAFGLYGATVDTTVLAEGALSIRAATATDTSPPITLNIVNHPFGQGLFARNFYTIYTIPNLPPSAPLVDILSATPNPLP